MIAVVEQELGFVDKVFLQVGHFAADAHGAQSGLSTDIGVRGGDYGFDFGEEVAGHFDAGYVAEGTEGEATDVLVRVIEVAGKVISTSPPFRLAVDTEFGLTSSTNS